MKLQKIISAVLSALLVIVFLLYIFMAINIPQITCWLLLHTIGRVHPRIARFIKVLNLSVSGLGFYWFVFFIEVYAGCELEFSGDEIKEKESALVMCNHVSNVDFLVLACIAYRKGLLGFLKFLAKKDLLIIPFLGFPGLILGKQIVLDRNWQKDQQSIADSVNSVMKDNIPSYVLIFPEGTRITQNNITKSNEFARERKLRELNQVVLPRVKGLGMMIKAITTQQENANIDLSVEKDNGIKYIYDVTIGYPPTREYIESCRKEAVNDKKVASSIVNKAFPVLGAPELLMKRLKGTKICVNIKKIPINTVPHHDEKQFNEWCYERFYRKEDMLSQLQTDAKENLKKLESKNSTSTSTNDLNPITVYPQQELSKLYSFRNEKILNEPFRFVPWW
ncbi:predicted protein [Naegleria gruberi]|uniref:Predicted protein n=1 Tax=Naegleria gruberi TaxID=5762 RepID=D2VKQ3_NAEGR|nr:uncharacterized protein NAEGRDRAFT_69474 [Naegleria gruberi]EFC42731.1 predicted protein [Naegleria gruberi]|eukprot:XP_002675475.1 predicted protein [Naegleria gruberi strain NEG-M]